MGSVVSPEVLPRRAELKMLGRPPGKDMQLAGGTIFLSPVQGLAFCLTPK